MLFYIYINFYKIFKILTSLSELNFFIHYWKGRSCYESKKIFWKLTLNLELVTYAVVMPIAIIGTFLIGDFSGGRFIYGTIALILAILFNIFVGISVRKKNI